MMLERAAKAVAIVNSLVKGEFTDYSSFRTQFCTLCRAAFLLLLLCLPNGAAFAEENGSASDSDLEYRRIYAPANRVEDWPLGSTPYLPVEPKEFDRLVGKAKAAASRAPEAVDARIAAVHSTARLDDFGILRGETRIKIESRGEGPHLLPLEPCSLPIEKAFWDHSPQRPAFVGVQSSDRPAVLVKQSDTLVLSWTVSTPLPGERQAAVEFALPNCAMKTFDLSLPSDISPSSSTGVMTLGESREKPRRTWRLELGGKSRFTLHLQSESDKGSVSQPSRLHQSTTYDFSQRGVEIAIQITLDVPTAPLEELVLSVSPDLRLIAVRQGEIPIPWSSTHDESAGRERVVLKFPEPLRGKGRAIRLVGIAPPVAETAWLLPDVRPIGLSWSEGQIRLLIPEPLVLKRLYLSGCRQIRSEPLPAPRRGEWIELQQYDPISEVRMELFRSQGDISLQQATAITVGASEVAGTTSATFAIQGAQRFTLGGLVARHWIIDTVRSEPPGAVSDWSLEPQGEGAQRLTIQLDSPLAPRRPIQLEVTGRWRRSALESPLSAERFRMLRFEGAKPSQDLMLLKAEPPFRLDLSGDEHLRHLDPAQNGLKSRFLPEENTLVPLVAASEGILFVADDALEQLQVSLKRDLPKYSAAIRIDATVESDQLLEATTIRCVPDSERIDRLRVHFSLKRETPLRWSLGSDEQSPLSAKRLPNVSEDQSEGETYELVLRSPRSVAFEVRAERKVPFLGEMPLSLVAVPDASSQLATIHVHLPATQGIVIQNDHLEAIPLDQQTVTRLPPVRAAFRYDPSRDTTTGALNGLTLREDPSWTRVASLWIWELHLESRYEESGEGNHRARLLLQNLGEKSVQIGLPDGAKLNALWSDGTRLPVTRSRDTQGPLRIDLPSGQRFPAITLQYETTGRALGMFRSVSAELPDVDLPTVRREWVVWVPKGYVPADGSLSDSTRSWRQRLFGPLGRGSSERPFDPTSRRSWSSLISDDQPHAEREPGNLVVRDLPLVMNSSERKRAKNPPKTAWQTTEARPGEAGFDRFHGTLVPSGAVSVRIVHSATLRMLGLISFLITFVIGSWHRARYGRTMTIAMGTAGAAALVLPAEIAPVATGIVLGIIANGCRWAVTARQNRFQRGPCQSMRTDFELTSHTVLALFATASLVLVSMSQCAEGKEPDAEIHKVFIPIDENRQPTGGAYQVPEAMFHSLSRQAESVSLRPRGWMITNAVYSSDLTRMASDRPMTLSRFRAVLDLHVFGHARLVRLPFDPSDFEAVPAEAKLNGVPLPLKWDREAAFVEFLVKEPGQYQWTLELTPKIKQTPPTVGFDLSIPPMPASRLVITVPRDAPKLSLPTAKGAIEGSSAERKIVAVLGATPKLSVHWFEGSLIDQSRAVFDAEELYWLKIRPGSVTLSARLKLRVDQGQLHLLHLEVDPSLRLVDAGEGLAIPRRESSSDSPQTISFDLRQPVSDEVTIDTEWLVTDASGLGQTVLPRLRVLGTRSSRRLLGISVDKTLLADPIDSNTGLGPIDVPQFVTAWGDSDGKPEFAFQYQGEETPWILATRPRPPQLAADQLLTVAVGRRRADILFEAQVESRFGFLFEHQVRCPSELEIESVSVIQEGQERVARWSRDDSGKIIVLMTGPVSGDHTIQVRGHGPVELPGRFTLPRFEILQKLSTGGQEPVLGSLRLHIDRRPQVLVDVGHDGQLSPIDALASRDEDLPEGRAVGAFRVEGDLREVALAVRENSPEVNGVMVTSLLRSGDDWRVQIDCELDVSGGVVDFLRMHIPESFQGPLTVEPFAKTKILDVPNQPYRRLEIWPATSIRGGHRFRIVAPLARASDDRLWVPEIRPTSPASLDRYLVLPTQSELTEIRWEIRGLQPSALPESFVALVEDDAAVEVYQVVGSKFEAIPTQFEPLPTTPQIHWAEVNVRWGEDEYCHMAASFDLEPAGLSDCFLQLHQAQRLTSVHIEGVPVIPRSVGLGTWQLPLQSRRFPQRIEILFAEEPRLRAPKNGRSFKAPILRTTLGTIAVDKTLWTVTTPRSWGEAIPVGVRASSRLEQSLLRLSSIAARIEATQQASEDEDAGTMADWYLPWARRLFEADYEVRSRVAILGPSQNSREAADKADRILAEQASVARRLGMGALFARLREQTIIRRETLSIWNGFRSEERPVLAIAEKIAIRQLRLRFPRPIANDQAQRVALALMFVAAVVLFSTVVPRRTISESVLQWPGAIAIVVGVFWWLCLTPSILGLLWIVFIVLLALLRPVTRAPDHLHVETDAADSSSSSPKVSWKDQSSTRRASDII